MWEDRREVILKYQLPDEKIHKFFEELPKGKVLATKCSKCGSVYFPPQQDCAKCKISGLDWVEIQSEGELITYTIINVKPGSFSQYPDYVVGIARFPEGFNVLAWVKGNTKELKIGSKVKLRAERREEKNGSYYTYYLEI